MNPNVIIKWLEIALLILIIATGGVAISVYVSGLIFHSDDQKTYYHLEREHWECLEHRADSIPREDTCILYRRSY